MGEWAGGHMSESPAIKELKEELHQVGQDVSEIRTNVAVLKEHATHAQSARQPGP